MDRSAREAVELRISGDQLEIIEATTVRHLRTGRTQLPLNPVAESLANAIIRIVSRDHSVGAPARNVEQYASTETGLDRVFLFLRLGLPPGSEFSFDSGASRPTWRIESGGKSWTLTFLDRNVELTQSGGPTKTIDTDKIPVVAGPDFKVGWALAERDALLHQIDPKLTDDQRRIDALIDVWYHRG